MRGVPYSGGYLWPPRPETAIPPHMIESFEKRGYVGQIKKNGACTVLFLKDGQLSAMNRHAEPHANWSPTPNSGRALITRFPSGNYVFVAELLHNKVPGMRDILYVNDILVWDGQVLLGTTFRERQEALLNIWEPRETPLGYNVIDSHLWVARPVASPLEKVFHGLTRPEDEGLVLKRNEAKLEYPLRAGINTAWQVKCRRRTKGYSF